LVKEEKRRVIAPPGLQHVAQKVVVQKYVVQKYVVHRDDRRDRDGVRPWGKCLKPVIKMEMVCCVEMRFRSRWPADWIELTKMVTQRFLERNCRE
jgi:hypothetical protein